MTGKLRFVNGARYLGLALGLFGISAAALFSGCVIQPETVPMQGPGGQTQQENIPKSTWTGAASGEQADALAQEIAQANNNTMKQFDQVEGKLDKLQSSENKELQTSQQALAKLEQLADKQGTGQITLFFKTGSTRLDKLQTDRLIEFLDYLGRQSRGRTVILVSIGSASAIGSPRFNKKLSMERSETPLPTIEQYLVNVPHKFYKVTGIGDMYAPKGESMQVEQRYQNVRIIAAYDTSDLSQTPGN
jgi:outer membrane protein OmpA-like peptidoglycan-associated protein